jgi:acyl carrier protein
MSEPREQPAPEALPPREELERVLLEFVNAEIMSRGKPIAAHDDFATAGVDSLALLKILLLVETRFGIVVPDEDLLDANVGSVATLADYLSRRA